MGTASYIVQPRRPLRWLDPGVFGTLGVGAGFAIAAKATKYHYCITVGPRSRARTRASFFKTSAL